MVDIKKIEELANIINSSEFNDIVYTSIIISDSIIKDTLDDTIKFFKEEDSDTILSKILEINTDISEDQRLIIEKYDLLKFDDLEKYKQKDRPKKLKKVEKKETEPIVEEEHIIEKEEAISENDIFSTLDNKDSTNPKLNRQKRYKVDMPIRLNKSKIYVSATSTTQFGYLTGNFYIFNNTIINGKIKISKTKSSRALGWVNLDEITVIGVNK